MVVPLRLLPALALISLVSAPAVASAQADSAARAGRRRAIVDRVVAVVNDEIILHSELMMRVAPLSAELERITDQRERKRRRDKLKSTLLEEMINEELIYQAASDAKLEVSAKEVQAALDEIKRQNKLTDDQLEDALKLQGYTMASYRRDVRRQILRLRAVNMLVKPRVSVSDDDVRARYDNMGRRSAAVAKVRLSHILIAIPDRPTPEQLNAAKERTTTIIEKARAGGDFAALAREFSDDTATKASGGELGWIERNSIPTEWESIVFSMSKGEVRGPINGPRGLHVFYVSDIKTSDQKSFEELKDKIRGDLTRQETDRQTKLWLDELRKKAHVEVKL